MMNRIRQYGVALLLATFAAAGCGQGGSQPSAPTPPAGGAPAPMAGSVELDKQVQRFKEVLTQDPKNVNALVGLGNLYMDNSRLPEAVDAYGKALEINPADTNVRVDMGTCYRRLGQSQRAVEEYQKALSYDPNHANGLMNSGIVLAYDLQKYQEAIVQWEKFLSSAPAHPSAGAIRQEVAKIKEALKGQPAAPGAQK